VVGHLLSFVEGAGLVTTILAIALFVPLFAVFGGGIAAASSRNLLTQSPGRAIKVAAALVALFGYTMVNFTATAMPREIGTDAYNRSGARLVTGHEMFFLGFGIALLFLAVGAPRSTLATQRQDFGRAFARLQPEVRMTLALLGAALAVASALWMVTWLPNASGPSLVFVVIVVGLTVVTLVRYARIIRTARDERRRL
jgi:hypothetical protein